MNIDHQEGQTAAIGETACPPPGTLLRYADRRLRRRKTGAVRRHLENCDSCAELAGLMVPAAPGPAPADLPPVERRRDRKLVARRLGFGRRPSPARRVLGWADWLWQVKAPILVPVGVTALLLFLLVPASPPVSNGGHVPLVYQFTEVNRMASNDLAMRGSAGAAAGYRATAGSLILLQHHASRSDLAEGDPVSLTIGGGPVKERVLLARAAADRLIEVPLVINRPGTYRIEIRRRDSGERLAVLRCTITERPSSTR